MWYKHQFQWQKWRDLTFIFTKGTRSSVFFFHLECHFESVSLLCALLSLKRASLLCMVGTRTASHAPSPSCTAVKPTTLAPLRGALMGSCGAAPPPTTTLTSSTPSALKRLVRFFFYFLWLIEMWLTCSCQIVQKCMNDIKREKKETMRGESNIHVMLLLMPM